jgi:hypothetical protein
MANDAIMAYLLCIDALSSDAKQETARVFIARAASRTTANLAFIHEAADSVLHKKVALEDD